MEHIQEEKNRTENLSVMWLDLANAYGSVPHRLIGKAMENFWLPEEQRTC